MNLNKLLKLQLLYCLIGILFNVVSWIVASKSGKPLTSTEPIMGLIAMSIYGSFLLSGHFRKITLYRILMVLAIIIFGYGGIIKHFILYSETPELYYSFLVMLIGMSINVFGTGLNIFAALERFKISE